MTFTEWQQQSGAHWTLFGGQPIVFTTGLSRAQIVQFLE